MNSSLSANSWRRTEMSGKTVVYTCITGGYDTLCHVPPSNNPNVDFICFTDKEPDLTEGWTIKPIPDEFKDVPKKKVQRMVKICPHRFLGEYDVSLWIDGNIQMLKDPSDFIRMHDLRRYPFYTRKHPGRDCIYEEGYAVMKMGKDSPENIKNQLKEYVKEKYPEHYGLVESNIILRRHNDPRCIILDNMWANQVLTKSHRDQLSFNYCMWKTGVEIGFLDVKNLLKNDFFKIKRHSVGG